MDIGALSPVQLTSIVLAYVAAVTVMLPVIAGCLVIAIQNYGKVKEAMGKLDQQNGDVTDLRHQATLHAAEITSIKTALQTKDIVDHLPDPPVVK
jgi:hypothetical protein